MRFKDLIEHSENYTFIILVLLQYSSHWPNLKDVGFW
jgi:hypothetical protein